MHYFVGLFLLWKENVHYPFTTLTQFEEGKKVTSLLEQKFQRMPTARLTESKQMVKT